MCGNYGRLLCFHNLPVPEAENVHIKTLNVVGDSQNSLKCSIRPLPMATDSLLQFKMLYCDLKLSVQLGNLGTYLFYWKNLTFRHQLELEISQSVGHHGNTCVPSLIRIDLTGFDERYLLGVLIRQRDVRMISRTLGPLKIKHQSLLAMVHSSHEKILFLPPPRPFKKPTKIWSDNLFLKNYCS